jgi:hypothetical protein
MTMTDDRMAGSEIELTEFEVIDAQKISGVKAAANGFTHLIMKGVAKDANGGVLADTDRGGSSGSVAPAVQTAPASDSPQNSQSPSADESEPAHQPWTGTHMHEHPSGGGADPNGDGLHMHMHAHSGDNDHSHAHGSGDGVVGAQSQASAGAAGGTDAGEMHGHGQPQAAANMGAGKAVVGKKIDQGPDVALANQILGLLGQAMSNEADEVAAGKYDESCDVGLLAQAADLVSCWLGHEQDGLLAQAVLTTAARRNLSEGDFAIPEKRAYPIHDEAHARNALSRVAQFGTASEKARVRAAVHRKYPGIGSGDSDGKSSKSIVAEGQAPVDTVGQGDDSPVAKAVAAAVTKAVQPYRERIDSLEADLAKVLALPRSGGPVLSGAVAYPPRAAGNSEKAAKAQLMQAKADAATDPADRASYRQLARELEEQARTT